MFSRRQQPEFCGWIAHSHLRQTRRLPEVCWPLPWAHLASRHWQHLTTSNNSNLWLTTLILHAFLAFLDLLDLTLKIRSEKKTCCLAFEVHWGSLSRGRALRLSAHHHWELICKGKPKCHSQIINFNASINWLCNLRSTSRSNSKGNASGVWQRISFTLMGSYADSSHRFRSKYMLYTNQGGWKLKLATKKRSLQTLLCSSCSQCGLAKAVES